MGSGQIRLSFYFDIHLQERQHYNLHQQFKQPVKTKLKTEGFFLHKKNLKYILIDKVEEKCVDAFLRRKGKRIYEINTACSLKATCHKRLFLSGSYRCT